MVSIIYVLFAAFVLAPVFNGLALSVLWAWFVEPLFGLPHLSIPAAIGIAMTAQLLLRIDQDNKKYDGIEPGKMVGLVTGKAVLAPVVTILCGLVVKQFL